VSGDEEQVGRSQETPCCSSVLGRPEQQALLVVNPRSRRGADSAETAADLLRRRGIKVVSEPCGDAAALPALISRMAPGIDRVVVGGGDGTLNAALPGLLSSGMPLGILPLGTANDLARTLGIPLELEAAAQVIAEGRLRPVDVGEVNGHPFFNVASIGLGVDLKRALTRDAKRRWGRLGYLVAALRTLGRLRPFSAEIVQGSTIYKTRTVHIAVGNGLHYGSGMTVAANARIDDGRLNLYSLEITSVWKLLRLLPALRTGKYQKWSEVQALDCEKIVVHTRRPRSVNTDGEITTRTPAHFRVLPAAIGVFVP